MSESKSSDEFSGFSVPRPAFALKVSKKTFDHFGLAAVLDISECSKANVRFGEIVGVEVRRSFKRKVSKTLGPKIPNFDFVAFGKEFATVEV
jgi:hypothetical protein